MLQCNRKLEFVAMLQDLIGVFQNEFRIRSLIEGSWSLDVSHIVIVQYKPTK